jgi:hypothetical protein
MIIINSTALNAGHVKLIVTLDSGDQDVSKMKKNQNSGIASHVSS